MKRITVYEQQNYCWQFNNDLLYTKKILLRKRVLKASSIKSVFWRLSIKRNLLLNPNLGLTKILEKITLLPILIDVVTESCKNSNFLIIESAFCHSNVELDMPNEQLC